MDLEKRMEELEERMLELVKLNANMVKLIQKMANQPTWYEWFFGCRK